MISGTVQRSERSRLRNLTLNSRHRLAKRVVFLMVEKSVPKQSKEAASKQSSATKLGRCRGSIALVVFAGVDFQNDHLGKFNV